MQANGEGVQRRVWMATGEGRGVTTGRQAGFAAVVLLLFGTLGVSTAFGMLLLLPL